MKKLLLILLLPLSAFGQTKISDMVAATAPTGTELIPILQGGANRRMTTAQLSALYQSVSTSWLSASGATLTGANTITGSGTNTLRYIFDNLITTPVNGAGSWFLNTTAATAGVPVQISPSLVLEGQGRASTPNNSQPVRFRTQVVPAEGTFNPTGAFIIGSSINNAAYTDHLNINTNGQVNLTNNNNDALTLTGSNAARVSIIAQNTNSAGNASFYFQNERGGFASYGGLLHSGSTSGGNFFGVGRIDRTFLISDGASSLGMAIGTLVNQPLFFGTNDTERFRILGNGAWGLSGANYGTSGQQLISQGSASAPIWSSAGSGWGLTGNASTVDGTNFVGTTDNIPLNFRANNVRAGRIESTSNANTFFGYQAGNVSTNDLSNTGVGYQSLLSTTTGFSNTTIGQGSLISNTTGNSNTTIGALSLQSNTIGNENNANGLSSLGNNTTGNNNTAIGHGSLSNNTTGSNNVGIGHNANVGSNNLMNATAIGAGATVNASNTMQLGNGSVTQVNIGTSTTATLVTGGLRVTGGTLGVNRILTSDASGNASWQVATGGSSRNIAAFHVIGTNANITAAAGTVYYLPTATLSANRTIDVAALNTNLDYLEIHNNEAGFTWSFTGASVYFSDNITLVTTILADTNYIIRRSNGRLRIIN